MEVCAPKKNKMIQEFIQDQQQRLGPSIARKNFYLLNDQQTHYKFNDNLYIINGEFHKMEGDVWIREYIVYYKKESTIKMLLIANIRGSFMEYYDYQTKEKFLSGDLHQKEELDKLETYITKFSKTILNFRKEAKFRLKNYEFNNNDVRIKTETSDHKIVITFDGMLHLYKLNNNIYTYTESYNNINLLLDENIKLKKKYCFFCCWIQ